MAATTRLGGRCGPRPGVAPAPQLRGSLVAETFATWQRAGTLLPLILMIRSKGCSPAPSPVPVQPGFSYVLQQAWGRMRTRAALINTGNSVEVSHRLYGTLRGDQPTQAPHTRAVAYSVQELLVHGLLVHGLLVHGLSTPAQRSFPGRA